jgi:hypothetical protein
VAAAAGSGVKASSDHMAALNAGWMKGGMTLNVGRVYTLQPCYMGLQSDKISTHYCTATVSQQQREWADLRDSLVPKYVRCDPPDLTCVQPVTYCTYM